MEDFLGNIHKTTNPAEFNWEPRMSQWRVPFERTPELAEKMDNETALLIIPINRECLFRDSLFNRDRLPA